MAIDLNIERQNEQCDKLLFARIALINSDNVHEKFISVFVL